MKIDWFENEELFNELNSYLDKNDAVSAQLYLNELYPSLSLLQLHPQIALEISDVICMCYDSADDEQFILRTLNYLQNKMTTYTTDKEKVANDYYRALEDNKLSLEFLDKKHLFNQYTEGYWYQMFMINRWLHRTLSEYLNHA